MTPEFKPFTVLLLNPLTRIKLKIIISVRVTSRGLVLPNLPNQYSENKSLSFMRSLDLKRGNGHA